MKILVHSSYSAHNIGANLGKAEYSYYFVLAGYLPALTQLGDVVTITDPESEVDVIFDACEAEAEPCVFLCFAPPHLVPVTLRCPTIPVVAWEFSTIPCEVWGDDPRGDWRMVFAHCGRVITLSNHTAALVRQAMGDHFPVFAIPTASYEAFASIGLRRPVAREALLSLHGYLFDTAMEPRFSCNPPWPPEPAPHFGPLPIEPTPDVPEAPLEPPPPSDLHEEVASDEGVPPALPAGPTLRKRISITVYYLRAWYHEVLRDVLPRPLKRLASICGRLAYRLYRQWRTTPPAALPVELIAPIKEMEQIEPVLPVAPVAPAVAMLPECEVALSGVVYVSVFAPQDGRKNWQDLLTGFMAAFKNNPGATLFLKLPSHAGLETYPAMYSILSRFAPFTCRVILFAGFLDDAEYRDLVKATTYYVNTSNCEGLCLPLMEFLCAGRPAIAPDHTAMADYIDFDRAFILRGNLEHNVWPFDPRDLFTAMRYRLDWESLVTAYERSYSLAVEQDTRYAVMSEAAQAAMREFCSVHLVRAKLSEALRIPALTTATQDVRMVEA